jgi:putative addiction module component (TIGR02574 family)
MSVDSNKLVERALGLSEVERSEIAASLIDSLDTIVDPNAEVEWEREILRRVEELKIGNTRSIPWPEVRKRLSEGL